jgi:hypothetical protein
VEHDEQDSRRRRAKAAREAPPRRGEEPVMSKGHLRGIGPAVRLAVAAAAVLIASPSAAQPARGMGGIGITVFEDSNYRGDNATFRNDEPDLRRARFDGRISSLQVAPGEVWEVCEGRNYQPPCQVFSGNEPDLGRRSWNDRISSLRRVRQAGRGPFASNPGTVVLYSDELFRGQSMTITGAVPSLGGFNDRARSVRVTGGAWELCEDSDYRKCRVVDRDWSNLSSIDMSRRVSSVRPAFNGRGSNVYRPPVAVRRPRLVLFDRDRYRGESRAIEAASRGLGGFGNRAQSVQVIGTWQMCDGTDFTGHCVTVSEDIPNLGSLGLNNRVSSARPLGPAR